MYKDVIKGIGEEISLLDKEIYGLDEKRRMRKEAQKAIEKLQAEFEASHNNLAVQKGVCPFPESCNLVDSCTKNHCRADVSQNGHAYRMS